MFTERRGGQNRLNSRSRYERARGAGSMRTVSESVPGGRTRDVTPRSTQPFRPWSSTWVKYYDRASRRRHSLGGYKRLHAEVRRRRRAGRVAVTAAAIGVLILVAVFYAILSAG